MITSSSLVSLFDMLRQYARIFAAHVSDLANWQADLTEGRVKTREIPIDLDNLEANCAELEFDVAIDQIEWLRSFAKRGIPEADMADGVDELRHRLVAHLKARQFLYVPPSKVKLFTQTDLYGPQATARFPSAIVDIEEAGKCLALGRTTACVFHLMRALEVGLQALAKDLDIPKLERNWQMIIRDVDKAVSALPHSTPAEKAHLGKRAAASAHLKNVKDAWRNDVMHPRATYTEEQALDIWNHSKALMAALAEFL